MIWKNQNILVKRREQHTLILLAIFAKQKKIKCSGGFPCTNCNKRNIECIYRSTRKRNNKDSSETNTSLPEPNDEDFLLNRMKELNDMNVEAEKLRDDWKRGVDMLSQFIEKNLSQGEKKLIVKNILSDGLLKNDVEKVEDFIKSVSYELSEKGEL